MYKFRTTNLHLNKQLNITLKSIYGMGFFKSNYILSILGISISFFLDDLNTYYKDILFFYLESYIMSVARIERFVSLRIKRLKDLLTYKGIRHNLNLPVHGQRTRTNANTQRSKRRKIEDLIKLNEKLAKKKK